MDGENPKEGGRQHRGTMGRMGKVGRVGRGLSISNSKDGGYDEKTRREWALPMTTQEGKSVVGGGSSAPVLVLTIVLVLFFQVGVWWVLIGGSSSSEDGPTVIGTATVDLNYTTYEGLKLSNGVNSFRGMRYAAAPIGNLRWRAPVDPIPSDPGTVEKAVAYRSICLGIGASYPADDQSEDCLFVNVWAPTNATAESRLPVWVFIQGGGYVANTNANWDGNEVVERSGHNIVMVDFNYRVGLWGFLASERVREDGTLNAGLLDQRMLLKWVKTHIASFGGDPDHVVIHGASAGAGSVAMHLIAYGGRNDNLFIGGMSESLFFPAQPFVRELEYQFDRVISQTGCEREAPDQQMACLRSKDVATLQAANHAQPFPGRPDPPMPLFYWTPCVDGQLLPDLPYRLFQKGQFIDVPMVLGTSNDEGSVFAFDAATSSDVAAFLRNNYPLLTSNDTTAILTHYPQLPPVPAHNPWFPTASRAYGEATFICPTHTLLSSYLSVRHPPQDENSNISFEGKHKPLYAYRYNVPDNYALARGLGVPHLSDAPAIFGPGNVPGAEAASYETYNAPIVDLVMAYWVSFVRALDPNAFDLAVGPPGSVSKPRSRFRTSRPRWEPVWEDKDGDEDGGKERMIAMKRLVVETEGARMEAVDAEERERCEFWKGLGSGRMRQKK